NEGQFVKLIYSSEKRGVDKKTIIDRPERIVLNDTSIEFYSTELGIKTIHGKLDVLNVSITGFLGNLKYINGHDSIIPGLTLFSDNPKISFYSTRVENTYYGFNIQNITDEDVFCIWREFIKLHTNNLYSEIVSSEELLELLTTSCFLKNDRRMCYG
ncbi:MAG: hypothetical protein HQK53_13720, partial [Oligoflexia bacterium]|nr:hypothetical protein [Oligoflexia bacterium]